MNKNRPLFKIDEEVILSSPEYPEFNGEYIVHRIDSEPDNHWYDLGFSCPEDAEFGGTLWHERCLKKKHKPSSYGFDELINEMNSVQV
jgi:hypothetical protein